MARNTEKLWITVRPEIIIVVAFALLLIPWKWVLSWITATAVHELFHYISIRLVGCKVWQIDIGSDGAYMKTQLDRPWKEFVSAIAGPIGSLSLALTSCITPRIAVCGYLQFLINLIPVYPNDGGRILKVIIEKWLPSMTAKRLLSLLNNLICVLSIFVGTYVSVGYKMGFLPILAALLIGVRIKKPCKQRPMRVQ